MKRLAIVLILLMIFPLTTIIGCDGRSESTLTSTPTVASSSISWNEAKYHIGERATVCGYIVDSRYASTSNGQPTFLNMGNAYPNSDRFTVVIWGSNRSNFASSPESYYYGKYICVTGLITEYQGVPQIEASYSSQIQIP